jgi:hypothetical protein
MRPYLEKTLHEKKAGGIAQDVGPEFKPQYHKKKKKERKKDQQNRVQKENQLYKASIFNNENVNYSINNIEYLEQKKTKLYFYLIVQAIINSKCIKCLA